MNLLSNNNSGRLLLIYFCKIKKTLRKIYFKFLIHAENIKYAWEIESSIFSYLRLLLIIAAKLKEIANFVCNIIYFL